MAQEHGWALGFQDETWWSRFAQPNLSSWVENQNPLRLVEQVKQKDDPEPKALACYGILLRFVDGRPVSDVTIQFLDWTCQQIEDLGKSVLAMIWDNARWHTSKAVHAWVRDHNREVKQSGKSVRILVCFLPVKSPWLNPIEPKWAHGKRRIVEPDRTLSRQELADRICTTFDCDHLDHLTVPENVS